MQKIFKAVCCIRTILAGAFYCVSVSGSATASECRIENVASKAPYTVVEIDKVWSGVRTSVGAAEPEKGKLFVAYYDAQRRVSLASADAASGKVCITHFDSVFGGWDGHNRLSMAIASDGTVHVAGNAHAQPLFYAAGRADDIDTVRQMPMTGQDEDRATYPVFYRTPGDRLVFMYRSGGAGNGYWLANGWQNGRWQRIGPLFSAVGANSGHVSAYPSSFVQDFQGRSHVAIVWRLSPDAASNFAVSYTSTSDFSHWSGISGVVHGVPLRPEDTDTVEATGLGSGLLNTAQIILAPDGTPVLFYTRYGRDNTNAIIAASPKNGKWTTREIAHSKVRIPIVGGGSIGTLPHFNATANGNVAVIHISFPGEPILVLLLDLSTMTTSTVVPSGKSNDVLIDPSLMPSIPGGLSDPIARTQSVTASGYDGPQKSQLLWYTQTVNRDKPLPCTPKAPVACNPPPSPLLWLIPAQP